GALAGCFGRGGGGPDAPTKRWLSQMKSEDPEMRQTAVQMLSRFRGQVRYVVPALLEALDDEDPIVQKTAAEGLRSLLRNPDLSDSRSVWEEHWRQAEGQLKKEDDLTSKERLDKEKAKLKNDEGVLQMSLRNFQKAEELFLEAVTKDEKSAVSWNNLGKCNANQGRLPTAIERFQRAIEEDSSFAPAYYNIADAYLEISKAARTDKTYEALQYVERAIELDRDKRDWASRWLKAKVLHFAAIRESRTSEKIELYKRADEAIDEAKTLAPNVAKVRNNAALIAYGRGLVYKAYKEVMEVDRLGYEVDPGFLDKLWPDVRRWYNKRGIDPPPRPKSGTRKSVKEVPPALRTPYGPGSR
ncbi:MAG: HEAT repeat domain-containing protein, partial [Planctomycetota bacterium]